MASEFGFNRVEFYTKDKFKVKYKIMPISLFLTVSTAIGNKFEFEKSLQTGKIIFSNSKVSSGGDLSMGKAVGNVLLLNESYLNDYRVVTHEIAWKFKML